MILRDPASATSFQQCYHSNERMKTVFFFVVLVFVLRNVFMSIGLDRVVRSAEVNLSSCRSAN